MFLCVWSSLEYMDLCGISCFHPEITAAAMSKWDQVWCWKTSNQLCFFFPDALSAHWMPINVARCTFKWQTVHLWDKLQTIKPITSCASGGKACKSYQSAAVPRPQDRLRSFYGRGVETIKCQIIADSSNLCRTDEARRFKGCVFYDRDCLGRLSQSCVFVSVWSLPLSLLPRQFNVSAADCRTASNCFLICAVTLKKKNLLFETIPHIVS